MTEWGVIEGGKPERPRADSARVLARPGAAIATLSLVIDGKHQMVSLRPDQVFLLIETGAEALRSMGIGER